MRTLGVALAIGLLATAVTVVLVASLRGHREPVPVQDPPPREPVVVAPPPREPERTPSSAFAPASASSPRELLEPAPMLEASELAALSDSHPGATLARAFPRLDSSSLRGAVQSARSVETVDRPARPLSRPTPSYPPAARKNRTEGFVRVRLRVDAGGRVLDAVVVESEPPGVFDQVALDAARRYRFEPASRKGEPIESTLEQRIVFRLQR